MQLPIHSDSFFVFDLDDTLYREYDFLRSGYRHIAAMLKPIAGAGLYDDMLRRYHNKEDVFQWITDTYRHRNSNIVKEGLLSAYREHVPDISLDAATRRFLHLLKEQGVPAGLITDGRSSTQRNKLRSLGIADYFTDIIISEEFGSAKPDERNYLYFQEKYACKAFCFFGDNTTKDFLVPARLGWRTICLLNTGRHIHRQSFDTDPVPDFLITSFDEITLSRC